MRRIRKICRWLDWCPQRFKHGWPSRYSSADPLRHVQIAPDGSWNIRGRPEIRDVVSAGFTHFMLGGSDVVIASRYRIGNLDGRGRLRRRLIDITYYTVTDAVTGAVAGAGTRASAGRDVGVRHHSDGCPITGESSLRSRRTGHCGGHDRDMDEHRRHFPH